MTTGSQSRRVPVATGAVTKVRAAWSLVVAGLALRLVLNCISIGTNDVDTFERFGRQINAEGIVWLYQQVRTFNHPPLVGYWSAAASAIAEATPLAFAPIFKLPIVLADFLTAYLLFRIWHLCMHTLDASVHIVALAVAVFAWNPASILVSGYHGNTDPLYAALCLLSVYLLQTRQKPFLAGLALAAALNVKLLPLILIPPMLLSFRPGILGPSQFKPAARFVGGLMIGVLPFVPLLIAIPWTLKKNVLAYQSAQDYWGISLALHWLIHLGMKQSEVTGLLQRWASDGRIFIMAIMLLIGLVARRRGWNLYATCAAAWMGFLIFTPGFALQYTVALVPMLCAVSIKRSLIYGTLAGVMLATTYAWYVVDWFPVHGIHTGPLPLPGIFAGIVVWLALVMMLIQQLRADPADAR